MTLARRLAAEGLGSLLLAAAVVGSGIMAERLAGGNVAVALLANTAATVGALALLIGLLGPVSGAHFNPVVSLVQAIRAALSCVGRCPIWARSGARVLSGRSPCACYVRSAIDPSRPARARRTRAVALRDCGDLWSAAGGARASSLRGCAMDGRGVDGRPTGSPLPLHSQTPPSPPRSLADRYLLGHWTARCARLHPRRDRGRSARVAGCESAVRACVFLPGHAREWLKSPYRPMVTHRTLMESRQVQQSGPVTTRLSTPLS